ncbi:MAG: hypothetical protein A2Y12_09850 [Planctomycetes bacterium GWF2_42_9]|nr:MAG: hypothetical protein A2Y12_09850 [Planctomycetes bacterium GWF2_42_9]
MPSALAVLFTILLLGSCIFIDALAETMPFVTYAMIFISIVWAGIDASSIELKKYKNSVASGPVMLVIGMLLLWPIVFPAYLAARYRIKKVKAELKNGTLTQKAISPNNQLCSTCGKHIGENSNFCPFCGVRSNSATECRSADTNGTLSQIERLAGLKDKGILTEDEFKNEKQKLLNSAR